MHSLFIWLPCFLKKTTGQLNTLPTEVGDIMINSHAYVGGARNLLLAKHSPNFDRCTNLRLAYSRTASTRRRSYQLSSSSVGADGC